MRLSPQSATPRPIHSDMGLPTDGSMRRILVRWSPPAGFAAQSPMCPAPDHSKSGGCHFKRFGDRVYHLLFPQPLAGSVEDYGTKALTRFFDQKLFHPEK
jgi:hypothetical protein